MPPFFDQNACILPGKGAQFETVARPVPQPDSLEVLIQVHSATLNPIDAYIQRTGKFIPKWPTVLVFDGAGVVHELGDDVIDLKKGDKVLFQAVHSPERGTLQQYTVAPATWAAKIPENISFDEATTFPTNFATAAIGIYGGQIEPPGIRGRYTGAEYSAP